MKIYKMDLSQKDLDFIAMAVENFSYEEFLKVLDKNPDCKGTLKMFKKVKNKKDFLECKEIFVIKMGLGVIFNEITGSINED